MSLEELVQALDFEHISTTGQIKYDVEKLRWVNHKWISLSDSTEITRLCRQFLEPVYMQVKKLSDQELSQLLVPIQNDLITLQDSVKLLAFYFDQPVYTLDIARTLLTPEKLPLLLEQLKHALQAPDQEKFLEEIKTRAKQQALAPHETFGFIRYGLTGSAHGQTIGEIIRMLGYSKVQQRLAAFITLFS